MNGKELGRYMNGILTGEPQPQPSPVEEAIDRIEELFFQLTDNLSSQQLREAAQSVRKTMDEVLETWPDMNDNSDGTFVHMRDWRLQQEEKDAAGS
jgi:hypothetical protein